MVSRALRLTAQRIRLAVRRGGLGRLISKSVRYAA